jgi:iron complex transport system ATP-binding protein
VNALAEPASVAAPTWVARALTFRYPGAPAEAVADVSLEVGAGEVVAILGPNGAGKSTLLRLLLGARHPSRGTALLEGRPAHAWPAVERARRVGVLPQHEEPAFPLAAREIVAMGRYPRLGPWRRFGARDRAAIESALARCRVAGVAERPFATLSGGERQRVRLARAFAQEPIALALDEPTASLDVAHEMEIWELLAAEARAGRAVLLTTHHLNLAARYADRLVLLDRGRVVAVGAPTEVLAAEAIERVYRWPVRIARHPGPGPDVGAPQVVPIRPSTASPQPEARP